MRDTIKISAFYRKFIISGLNKFPSLSKFKRHQKIDEKKYKSIIKKFHTIYFNEVYFFNRPFYFLIGGRIKLVRCGNWIKKSPKGKEGYEIASHSIGLFWYLRPCVRFLYSIDIRKQKGSTNMIPRIENEWKKSNEITLLPLSKDEKKKHKNNNSLAR